MLKYKGGGFLHDIPARDLTDEEAEKFDLAWLIGSGLYELSDEDNPEPREAVGRKVKHGNRRSEA